MSYCKTIFTFFSDFSRGEIIAIIAILATVIIFIATIVFIILWDTRIKRQSIIDAFTNSIIELKTVIETHSIPNSTSSDTFFTSLFAKQDSAMSIIRGKLEGETITEFDKKWAEYKEERERYKRYWDTGLKGKFLIHSYSNQLNTIIDELVDIVNKI